MAAEIKITRDNGKEFSHTVELNETELDLIITALETSKDQYENSLRTCEEAVEEMGDNVPNLRLVVATALADNISRIEGMVAALDTHERMV
jgi:hypothetical protein